MRRAIDSRAAVLALALAAGWAAAAPPPAAHPASGAAQPAAAAGSERARGFSASPRPLSCAADFGGAFPCRAQDDPAWTIPLAESLWRGAATGFCPGAYADAGTGAATASDAAEVRITGARLAAAPGAFVQVSGDVRVHRGDRLLSAAAVRLDERSGIVAATGTADIAMPGLHVRGRDARLHLDAERMRMADAEFVFTDLQWRGGAREIERTAAGVRLALADLTRCPPGSGLWRLRAAQLRVDARTGSASARHLRLELGAVPIFYAPYLRFPAGGERRSGFLFPSLAYDGKDGADITAPFYLNLAPNADATLSARGIGRRGIGIEGEFRHLGSSSRSELRSAFLPSDAAYDGRIDRADFAAPPDAAPFHGADRWMLGARHDGRFGAFATRIDIAAVSDNDYFLDLGSELALDSRISLERRAEIEYRRGAFDARLWAQGFQRLEPGSEPHRRLPQIDLRYAGGRIGPLGWSVSAALASFRPAGTAADAQPPSGERLHVEPRLELRADRPWGFAALGAGTRHTAYSLDDAGRSAGAQAAPRRAIRLATAEGGLFFERPLRGGGVQTLAPRIHYLRQSFAAQDHLPRFDAARTTFSYPALFRDNRFAGIDRIGDADRLSVAVASSLLAPGSGAERLSARFGAQRHLRAPRVGLRVGGDATPRTAAAAEFAASAQALRARATLAWDADRRALDEAGIAFSYRPDPADGGRVLHAGYRRRARFGIDQTDVAVHWPVARHWNGFARWSHDWEHGRSIEMFAGVGYANCCLAVKALWHRTLDAPRNRPAPLAGHEAGYAGYEEGVLLQVVLRGLAGIGGKIESRLERGIRGYRRDAPR